MENRDITIDNDKFNNLNNKCSGCGHPMPLPSFHGKYCPKCGEPTMPNARYCIECGNKL
ncbi:MAG: zinc-ribbon domain-containing protein [Candidatus Heimdallarchaeota archaeon]|nr:MAG: zinc-ribbon domain-containing protein [Candidatus Heimdallarchaeota archaeon]